MDDVETNPLKLNANILMKKIPEIFCFDSLNI